MLISKAFNYVYCRYLAYKYLFRGASMIEEAYSKANGKPFTMHTPERKIIMITSQNHICEMDKALRRDLSLHAVAKEVSKRWIWMTVFYWPKIVDTTKAYLAWFRLEGSKRHRRNGIFPRHSKPSHRESTTSDASNIWSNLNTGQDRVAKCQEGGWVGEAFYRWHCKKNCLTS